MTTCTQCGSGAVDWSIRANPPKGSIEWFTTCQSCGFKWEHAIGQKDGAA